MKHRIAVAQMTSNSNREHNLETCRLLIEEADGVGARLLCLPENFAFIGENEQANLEMAEPLHGPTIMQFRKWAQDHAMWLSLGGFQETKNSHKKMANAHIIVDPQGNIRAVYRKLHLFSARIGDKTDFDEGKHTEAGTHLRSVETPVGHLGLSICYDLRFGEMYNAMARAGAEVMLVPSAFTAVTGKAHWEVLLRARAIESQSYVAAAAQTGQHNEKRRSHGHAMIIDPWGTIIAQCSEGTRIAVADLDLAYVHDIRRRMPVLQHRRQDAYAGPILRGEHE